MIRLVLSIWATIHLMREKLLQHEPSSESNLTKGADTIIQPFLVEPRTAALNQILYLSVSTHVVYENRELQHKPMAKCSLSHHLCSSCVIIVNNQNTFLMHPSD
eukprot:TRINITY_DN5576_c0_g1_i5.p1 TRINITY_DN5576_c0_g1~~TRINITY_DN5576_c0_g1_i5.p1  ORF type:complete len:104 (+),score=8.60 TRINITY_DN5576_c0_g1_i5:158-469(+)